MSREVPADLGAEQALIGAVLLQPGIMHEARWTVTAGDFFKPAHQQVWAAMCDLYATGRPVDPVTVADAVRATVPDPAALLTDALNTLPASSRWRHYADIVIRHSASRQLVHVAGEAASAAMTADDPWRVAADLESQVKSIGRASGALPPDLWTADGYAERGDTDLSPWLVEGWMRHKDRTIIVAEEGIGKSTWTLQIAMMVAQGVNPLWPSHRFAPCTTLVIDLENPEGELRRRIRDMKSRLRSAHGVDYVDDLCHVWHREGGIDLRSRATARELDAILTDVRPALVVLCPLYKAFRSSPREDHEQVAAGLQAELDDLRARFGFALIIEHHAPKPSGGARDMVPFGSSLWLRWPEYGIALTKPRGGDGSLANLGRFRGDRIRNAGWPTSIHWGQTWPWEARYEHGSPWAPQTPSASGAPF